MRLRYRQVISRLSVVALVAALVVTCRDLPFEPGMEVSGSLDVSGLMATAQETPIPIDSLVIELRRTSDSTIAFRTSIPVDSVSISADGDTVAVDIQVPLSESTEQFYLYLAVVGDGEVWFEVRDMVTASIGSEPTVTEVVEPSYVGPGADANRVTFSLSDTTITGGDSVLVTGTAYIDDSPVDGALIWFESSDPSVVPDPTQVGRNQAWVSAPAAMTDSVTVSAVCPTGAGIISTNGTLHFFARPNQISLVSGNNQEMVAGAVAEEWLVVQIFDAAGNPYTRGYPITFSVTSGPTGTSVSPTSVTSDVSGYAQAELIAGNSAGAIQVNASASGLSGSPVTFAATVVPGAATGMLIHEGNAQTAEVGTSVAVAPAVRITDSNSDPIPNLVVDFAVTYGGGSATGTTDTTDATGVASVGSWTLGTTAGQNILEATSAGLQPVAFTATGLAGAAANLAISSGDGQTGTGGAALAQPLIVLVTDQNDNPVSQVDVTWATTFGSLDLTTSQTNTQGLAQTSWTLDADSTNQTATATVSGLDPVTFSATLSVGATDITINEGNNQTATVASAVEVNPSVSVTDGGGNPLIDVEVTFAVESGGGSITGETATTDGEGMASVGSWTLGEIAGANTLSATVTGLDPVTFTATGVADAADTVAIISGDNQTAEAGQALASPLVVEVQDQYGNAVSGETVNWQALNGTVSPTTNVTDGNGRAQTSWTLGVNSASQTASATVGSLTPAIFSATATFPTPTILLNLIGTDRISVGGTADLQVTLSAPAGAGGITVTVTSDNTGVITVQATGTVSIAEGSTTGQITLTGVGGGTSTIRANATGYVEGTLVVESSLQVMSLPQTSNVPFGGTASLPISISTPAQSGGETITLISDNPSAVSVQTPTVTIPEGSTNGSATVAGVSPGTAVITATSTNFGSAQSTVSSTANLNIEQSSISINESFGGSITIRLESGGFQIAAPSPGIEVTLTSDDPTCAVATSPVTIATGLAEVTSTVTYGGSATTSCNTMLTATATDITSDAMTVYVNPAPAITVYSTTVGSGLQESSTAYLAAGNHGGIDVTVSSSDPSVMLVSPDANTPGTESITITLNDGVASFGYYQQGLEGAVGTATLSVTATGFIDGDAQIDVVQPAVVLYGLVSSTTSLSNEDVFQARVGVPDASLSYLDDYQYVRAGSPAPFTATITSSNVAVAQLVTTADTGGSVTVQIGEGENRSPSSVATGGVAFDPVGPGTDTVAVSIPGFVSLPMPYASQEVTVTATGITAYAARLGAGLQRDQNWYLGASNHGGVDVVLTSSDPSALLIAPDETTVGTESLTVSVPDGSTTIRFYTQGLEGAAGTVTITATATGFTEGSAQTEVVQPAVSLYGLISSTTSLSPDDPFQIRIGAPEANLGYMAEYQEVRAGAPAAYTATVTATSGPVGRLVTTSYTGDTVTVEIVEGVYNSPSTVATGGVAYDGTAAGTDTVTVSIPGFASLPFGYSSREVTVTAPAITVYDRTVGAGLQAYQTGYLSASDHGGVDVVVTSSDPTTMVLSPDDTTAGTESITISVPDGSTGFNFYMQGVEGVVGEATITATATGFVEGSSTITIAQPAVQIYSLGSSWTTLSDDDPFQIRVGVPNGAQTYINDYQNVRAGGPGYYTATVTSSAGGVGQLVTTTLTDDTVTVEIPEGLYYSPGSVAAGGVAFDPLTAGMTTVRASIPGFVTLPQGYGSIDVTVSAPTITVYNERLGAGLQTSQTVRLEAGNHGGVDVTIRSSNSSVLLLSPDGTTIGSDSVTISIADGSTSATYYIQGLESATGTVTITATAPGFVDGTAAIDVALPAFTLSFLGTSKDTDDSDDPFTVRVGVPNVSQTYLDAYQAVRFGAPQAVTATITNSDDTVGQLVTTAGPSQSVSIDVPQGLYTTPTSVAAGGVAFGVVGVGSTTVTASIPGYIVLPAGYSSLEVTVTTP